MFGQSKPDVSSTNEATVIAVDVQRSVCKCLTRDRRPISNVRWMSPSSSDVSIPSEGDEVQIEQRNGSFYITGYLPVASVGDVPMPGIKGAASATPDIADYSPMKSNGIKGDRKNPQDVRPGDRVLSNKMGGIIALLRSGTAILKSSSMSQIIVSKLGDLVRVVSRNYELFTDMDATYKVSTRGKLFSVYELYRSQADSRSERATVKRFEGMAKAGESIGKGYATAGAGSSAADDGSYFREYLYDASNALRRTTEKFITGRVRVLSQNSGGSSRMEEIRAENIASIKVHGGDTSYYKMDETSIHLDVGTNWKVDIDKQGIRINSNGKVVIDANTNGKLTVTTSGDMQFNASGNVNFNAGGNFNVKASTINLN